MTVPTYDKFMEPILRYLASCPDGARVREVYEAAANALNISEETRQEILPSRAVPVYQHRAWWAHERLKRAGLSSRPHRGIWKLTEAGIEYARSHPSQLDSDEVTRLATDFMDVRLRQPTQGIEPAVANNIPLTSVTDSLASPDDRLSQAVSELRRTVLEEVREALAVVSPSFFETIVLDLLHRMGYGTRRADLQRVGGPGDAGIDGVISLDKLGLEKVYIQAKRWQTTVGRPEIQAFYGALAGQKANKGVFITTSDYSNQAKDFAKSVEKIVLIDGERLAGLMIDHEVGASSRTVKIPKLDSDYFDEE